MAPTIAPDGAGGAIVTWYDYDIYAQRLNASGAVQWTADGVALCTASGPQTDPVIVPDGTEGAIVTWHDFRSGTDEVYAQRVDASGAVQWTTNGVTICAAINDQGSPMIASDGAGGAIVTWHDYRSADNFEVYAQRVDTSGNVQWTADGVALCTATDHQTYPVIVSDSSGGAIIAWIADRDDNDIYAQRITHQGNVGSDPTLPVSTMVTFCIALAMGSLALRKLTRTGATIS